MVTLNTSPGDGGLSVGVDAFGGFGSNSASLESTDAFYDPLGATETSGTVFQSYLAVGINGDSDPSRIVLSENNVGNFAFTNSTATDANSTFNVAGLDFVLDQRVSDFPSDGSQRVGSTLFQNYTITNTTNAPIEFELARYLDGDLQFDGSIQDTGGAFVNEIEGSTLFETDSGDSGLNSTTFVGIANTSDISSAATSYEISEFSGLRDRITAGEPLSNTVQGDGADEDLFIDQGDYDVTLALNDTYTLAPGESLTYETLTLFGNGVPEDVETDLGGGDTTGSTEDIDVYRFFRTDTQTEFYTTTDIEREFVLENLPQYDLEGIAFVGAPNQDPLTGTSPVYRFFNNSTGVHLYTADENEAAFVDQNLSNYTFEGTPYYGYDTQVEGTVPLYRYYNAGLDAHFYTPYAEEREFYINSPDYVAEGGGDGIAFYVELPSEF